MPKKFSKKRTLSFGERVYKVVKKIPKGKAVTYKMVAKLAGSPRAWRAVGNILNKNRNSEVPCHRVICSDGDLGGYKEGTKKKALLLKKEGYLKRRWVEWKEYRKKD